MPVRVAAKYEIACFENSWDVTLLYIHVVPAVDLGNPHVMTIDIPFMPRFHKDQLTSQMLRFKMNNPS